MNIISYIRVSTKAQGNSGLGLEGQQAAVDSFVGQHRAKVIAEYREVETGKRNDRTELAKALAHARRTRATLVVAKLDRLARNVAFTIPGEGHAGENTFRVASEAFVVVSFMAHASYREPFDVKGCE